LRCLIVDDNPEFLDAASRLLREEGVDVPAVASTSAEALRLAQALRPDVILVDIDLDGEDGLEVARELVDGDGREGRDGTKVILISTHDEDEFADLIALSPALGFISKAALSGDSIRRLVDDGHATG
jgi:CheY-like chemotaxis protein